MRQPDHGSAEPAPHLPAVVFGRLQQAHLLQHPCPVGPRLIRANDQDRGAGSEQAQAQEVGLTAMPGAEHRQHQARLAHLRQGDQQVQRRRYEDSLPGPAGRADVKPVTGRQELAASSSSAARIPKQPPEFVIHEGELQLLRSGPEQRESASKGRPLLQELSSQLLHG